MIYFWNDKQLARDLKNGKVAELHKFIYLMIYFFVPSLFNLIIPKRSEPTIPTELGWVGFLLLPVGIVIFYFFYKVNSQGDSLHFIERYICLSFPVGIRLCTIMIPIGLLVVVASIFILMPVFDKLPTWPAIISTLIITILLLWYYITRLRILLKIASGQMD